MGRFVLILHLLSVNPQSGHYDFYHDDYFYDNMTLEECTDWVNAIDFQRDGIGAECVPQWFEYVKGR